MGRVCIGIGSNLGDKEKNIIESIWQLRKKCRIRKISPIYKTEPVGYKNQDWFLNCALEAETKLKPDELLVFLKSIEKRLGRRRVIINGPRIIDLDILFYDGLVLESADLIIPHPRLHDRLFVLEPLNQICPKLVHPILNKTIKRLASDLEKTELVEIYESFEPP